MKLYQITYEIIFAVKAENEEEAKKEAADRIEPYLEAPGSLRILLQAAVMDAEPNIKEIKEVS